MERSFDTFRAIAWQFRYLNGRALPARKAWRPPLVEGRNALAAVYTELDKLAPSTFETQSYRPKTPLFMIPLGIAVLLMVLYHGTLAFLAWRATRETAHA